MKRWIRRTLLVLFAAAVVAGLVYVFRPQPVPIEVAEVQRGMMRVTVDEEGRTRVRQRYVVAAPLAGRLQRVTLKEGDAVTAGQTILARIEPTDPALLDVRGHAQAQAQVGAAEAAVGRAQAVLDRAEAALEFARREHRRVRDASEAGAAAPHELDAAANTERLAAHEFRSAQAGRDITRFELEQARSALLRTAPQQDGPGDATPFEIPSPINGRVLRLLQESQTVVQAGAPLLELGDPQDLEIVIDVLSTDAVRIAPGSRTTIERWGGENDLTGVVRLIEPSGFTKISALGVEEQRVNVIVDFDGPPESRASLGDGFRIESRIIVWERPDTVIVPASALFRLGSEWATFVIEDGRAARRLALIGRQNGLQAEVVGGLSPGERVIVHPSDRVHEGVRVRAR